MKYLVIIGLFVFAMLAFWGSLFTVFSLLLMQWSSMFWCGLVSIVSGVMVTALLNVKVRW
jgi:hypothetical protein